MRSLVFVQFGDGHFGAGASPPTLEVCGCLAFARSLHYERADLDIRVVDLSPALPTSRAAALLLGEITASGAFRAAGYDAEGARRVHRIRLQQPSSYDRRQHVWSATDVILVTGGGRGVMAECALGLARATGACVVLVGRSPAPSPAASASDELSSTLARFEREQLPHRYFSCDVTDCAAVNQLVERVRAEIGPITAVVHGAMTFRPRRVDSLKVDEAVDEVSPKILGAQNLLEALGSSPPRLLIGFTSISMLQGMPGSAAYALSNELLEILIRRFAADHPETSALCIAWSMWGQVGEAARIGSARQLRSLGLVLEEMAPVECVRRFVQLFTFDPGAQHVLVTGRTFGFDTWNLLRASAPPRAATRFVEHVVFAEPGVELVTRTRLTLDRDRYLMDHVFHGMYVVPTVIALEAVAQAAQAALGEHEAALVRLEDVRMPWPIVVDAERGVEIEIRAEVAELMDGTELHVRASIRTEQTSFLQDYVTAVVVFGARRTSPREDVDLNRPALPIYPPMDLYGRRFFVGPLFQRMQTILAVDPDRAICLAEHRRASAAGEEGFAPGESGALMLGDPYFRDTLLHTSFLHDLRSLAFTAHIGRIEFFDPPSGLPAPKFCISSLKSRQPKEYQVELTAVSEEGYVLERMEGYRLHIVERHPEWPSAEELLSADARDEAHIQEVVGAHLRELGMQEVAFGVLHRPGLEQLPRAERRAIELPLVRRLAGTRLGRPSEEWSSISLDWLPSGKPQLGLSGASALDVSITHVGPTCLCVIGEGPQGCDLATLNGRTEQEWLDLLGEARKDQLMELVEAGDTLDQAGTRLWTALEAVRKATNELDQHLSLLSWRGRAALLLAESAAGRHTVLLTPVKLIRSNDCMVAVVTRRAMADAASPAIMAETDSGPELSFTAEDGIHVVRSEELGCLTLEQIIHVSWRECGNGRTVLSNHYFSWFYRLLDLILGQATGRQFAADVATGRWSAAVRWTEGHFDAEASAYDRLRARLWVSHIDASVVGLCCEFSKLDPDRGDERIALLRGEGTFLCFDDGASDARNHRSARIDVPAPLRHLYERFRMRPAHGSRRDASSGERVDAPPRPAPSPRGSESRLLHTEQLRTSSVESDLIGNINAMYYFFWQEGVRAQFLNKVLPGYSRRRKDADGSDARGELVCTYARTDYLRELMPFDDVQIRLFLDSLGEREAWLRFEYDRIQGSEIRKMAVGRQRVTWVALDSSGVVAPAAWPSALRDVFSRALQE